MRQLLDERMAKTSRYAKQKLLQEKMLNNPGGIEINEIDSDGEKTAPWGRQTASPTRQPEDFQLKP